MSIDLKKVGLKEKYKKLLPGMRGKGSARIPFYASLPIKK